MPQGPLAREAWATNCSGNKLLFAANRRVCPLFDLVSLSVSGLVNPQVNVGLVKIRNPVVGNSLGTGLPKGRD